MRSIFYLLVLSVFSATLADQELEDFAQNILQLLNPNGVESKHNSVLLSLTNGESLSKDYLNINSISERIQVNITFTGAFIVSAQKNSDKVVVSSKYLGGAAVRINERHNQQFNNESLDPTPVDPFLKEIYEKNVNSNLDLDASETAVLLAHGSGTVFGVKVASRRAETEIVGGFVVGSKTRVTKSQNPE